MVLLFNTEEMGYRKLVFIIILFAINLTSKSQNSHVPLVTFEEVTINGKSNIEKFDLHFIRKNDSTQESIVCILNGNALEFCIPVKCFKSEKKYIEEDFKKLINENEFPFIRFQIGSDQLNQLLNRDSKIVKTSLTISGKSNDYPIQVLELIGEESNLQLCGKIELYLSEYAIKPVSKLFGFIRVEDKVVINFKLNLQSNFLDVNPKSNFTLTHK